MSGPVLSKKQQKTLAFRAKQKSKPAPIVPEDVPEMDLLDDEDGAIEPFAEGSKGFVNDGKKRKRDDDKGESDSTRKGKGKAKTAWDEEDEADEKDGVKKKSKKEVKQRFILFIGNLGYKTTREDVANHFKETIGHIPSVRLLTERPNPRSPANQIPKSRGIAFLELPNSSELQACLKLHHSELQGRIINVELTAGGGGKSGDRMEKIKERNGRVKIQRERRAEKEGGGENGVVEEAEKEVLESETPGKVKVRGGRRVKNKPKTNLDPSAKRTNSDVVTGAASGWATRTGSSGPSRSSGPSGLKSSGPRGGSSSRGRGGMAGGRGMGGKKWEPTGANALVVG